MLCMAAIAAIDSIRPERHDHRYQSHMHNPHWRAMLRMAANTAFDVIRPKRHDPPVSVTHAQSRTRGARPSRIHFSGWRAMLCMAAIAAIGYC